MHDNIFSFCHCHLLDFHTKAYLVAFHLNEATNNVELLFPVLRLVFYVALRERGNDGSVVFENFKGAKRAWHQHAFNLAMKQDFFRAYYS